MHYGIFKAGHRFIGRTVGVAAEHLTGAELAAGLSEAVGEKVRYDHVPVQALRGSGGPGADMVANMFQMIDENREDYCGHYGPALSRFLNPQLQTFAGWLAVNARRFKEPAGQDLVA